MQQELICTLDQRLVNDLLVTACTQRNGTQTLCFTTGENRTSVRAWQITNLAPDRTNLCRLTTVQTLALIEHSATHRLFLYIVIISVNQRSNLINIYS